MHHGLAKLQALNQKDKATTNKPTTQTNNKQNKTQTYNKACVSKIKPFIKQTPGSYTAKNEPASSYISIWKVVTGSTVYCIWKM